MQYRIGCLKERKEKKGVRDDPDGFLKKFSKPLEVFPSSGRLPPRVPSSHWTNAADRGVMVITLSYRLIFKVSDHSSSPIRHKHLPEHHVNGFTITQRVVTDAG